MHRLPDPERTRTLGADDLRAAFLVRGLFTAGRVTLRHVDLDRVVLGGAVPLGDTLQLDPPASLAAEHFLERREMGVLNIGGPGVVRVDGHELRAAAARRRLPRPRHARRVVQQRRARSGRRASIS